ncbi:hypothetical protein Tco_0151467 [Tanacetum coccineum]
MQNDIMVAGSRECPPMLALDHYAQWSSCQESNPLALVAAAQHYPDTYSSNTYYQAPKPHKNNASSSRQTPSTRTCATTRKKGKEIVKPVTPASESVSEEDNFRPTYDAEPLEKVQSDDDYNVFSTERQHYEQPESIYDTYVVKMVDSNVIPDSSDM